LQDILGIYIDAVTDPKLQEAAKGDTWFTSSKMGAAEKLFERLNANIIPGVTGIIKGIAESQNSKELQNLTAKVSENQTKADLLKSNLFNLINSYTGAISEVDTSKVDDVKIGIFNKIGDIIGKFNNPVDSKNVETQKKMLDNISKFINKANSIDVDKIKSTTDMFQ
jgi:chaperonin cofactor prefoldin